MTTAKPICPLALAFDCLDLVEWKYRNGMISYADLVAYIRSWNAGPHFTQAVWCDGAIRNFDPERNYYRHLSEEFGVRP